MGMRGRKTGHGRPPAEFGFFSQDEWNTFNDVITLALNDRQLRFSKPGPGSIQLCDEQLTLGLLNVAQLCHGQPVGDWLDVFDSHLDVLLDAQIASPDPALVMATLRARLVPEDLDLGSSVCRSFVPGINEMLALDLPTTVRSLANDELHELGMDERAAWELAMRNTREDPEPLVPETLETNEGAFLALEGGSFFVASRVRWLDELIDVGEHGAVVAVPNRHLILAHPIEDLSVVGVISTMVVAAAASFRDGPGSVCPLIYWWHRGRMALLPIDLDAGQLRLTPPADFVAVLQHLAD